MKGEERTLRGKDSESQGSNARQQYLTLVYDGLRTHIPTCVQILLLIDRILIRVIRQIIISNKIKKRSTGMLRKGVSEHYNRYCSTMLPVGDTHYTFTSHIDPSYSVMIYIKIIVATWSFGYVCSYNLSCLSRTLCMTCLCLWHV